jgi:hypothetical protein
MDSSHHSIPDEADVPEEFESAVIPALQMTVGVMTAQSFSSTALP